TKEILNSREYNILNLLLENENQALSRDIIIENIWGKNSYPSNRTVDNYMVKLRRWCESDPDATIEITSVRGVGYRLQYKK
ncbi:helix-turn-helix domain-containing protein, partial [bacterium]|nr:helix-turn-helix domain-containing protein [bacterium]